MKIIHLLYFTLIITFTLTACKDKNFEEQQTRLTTIDLLVARNWVIKSVINESNGNEDLTSYYSGRNLKFYDDDDYTYIHNLSGDIEFGTYNMGGGIITFTPGLNRIFASKFDEAEVTFTQLLFKVTIATPTSNMVLSIEMEER